MALENGQTLNTNNAIMSTVDFHDVCKNMESILKEELKKDVSKRFIKVHGQNSNLLLIDLRMIYNKLLNLSLQQKNENTFFPIHNIQKNNGLIGIIPEYSKLNSQKIDDSKNFMVIVKLMNQLLNESGYQFENKKDKLWDCIEIINLLSFEFLTDEKNKDSAGNKYKSVLSDRFDFYKTKYVSLPNYSQSKKAYIIKEDFIELSFKEPKVLDTVHKSFKSYCIDVLIKNLQNEADQESNSYSTIQQLRSYTTNEDNIDKANINEFVNKFIDKPVPRLKEVLACKLYVKYLFSISKKSNENNKLLETYLNGINKAFDYYDQSNYKSDDEMNKKFVDAQGNNLFEIDLKSMLSIAKGVWNILKIRGTLNDGALMQGIDSLKVIYPCKCKYGKSLNNKDIFKYYLSKFIYYMDLNNKIGEFHVKGFSENRKQYTNENKERIKYLVNYLFIYNYVYAPLINENYKSDEKWHQFYEMIDDNITMQEFIQRISEYYPDIINAKVNDLINNVKLKSIVDYIQSIQLNNKNVEEQKTTVYVGVLNDILEAGWATENLSKNIFKKSKIDGNAIPQIDILKYVRIITNEETYQEMKDNFILSIPFECKCYSPIKEAEEPAQKVYIKTEIDEKNILPIISDAYNITDNGNVNLKSEQEKTTYGYFMSRIKDTDKPLIYIRHDMHNISSDMNKDIIGCNCYIFMMENILLDLIFEQLELNKENKYITCCSLYSNQEKKSDDGYDNDKKIKYLEQANSQYRNNVKCMIQVLGEKYNICDQGLDVNKGFVYYNFNNTIKSLFSPLPMKITPYNVDVKLSNDKYGIIVISSILLQGKSNRFGIRSICGDSYVFDGTNSEYKLSEYKTFNTPVEECNESYKLKDYPTNKIKKIIKEMYEQGIKKIILVAKNPYSNTFEYDQKRKNYYFLDAENINEFIGDYNDIEIFPMNYDLYSSMNLTKSTTTDESKPNELDYGCSFVVNDTENILTSIFGVGIPSEYPIANFTGFNKYKKTEGKHQYKTTINYKLNYWNYTGKTLRWATSLTETTDKKDAIIFVLFCLHCYSNLSGTINNNQTNSFKINPFEKYSNGSGDDKNSIATISKGMQYYDKNSNDRKYFAFNYLSFMIYIFDLYNERAKQ